MREIGLAGGRARGVDYSGGRRAHMWAKEAGFELVHVDAYHPHYLTGDHKGFWNWTLRNAGLGLVTEGVAGDDEARRARRRHERRPTSRRTPSWRTAACTR